MNNFIKTIFQFVLFLVLISLSGFIGTPMRAQATSGACSYHGGVNCSAGRQPSGTVYCNDPGWTDSIVPYDFMMMCQNTALDECIQQKLATHDRYATPTDVAISNFTNTFMTTHDMSNPENQFALQVQLNYLYTIRDRENQAYRESVVAACKNDLAQDTAQQVQQVIPTSLPNQQASCSGDLVLNNNNQCVTRIDFCRAYNGIWDGQLNDKGSPLCEYCKLGFTINSEGNACVPQQPQVAPLVTKVEPEAITNTSVAEQKASTVANPVVCDYDHSILGGVCVSNDQICKNSLGEHGFWTGMSSGGNLPCNCESGYVLSGDGQSCVTNVPIHFPAKKGFWSWLIGLFGF